MSNICIGKKVATATKAVSFFLYRWKTLRLSSSDKNRLLPSYRETLRWAKWSFFKANHYLHYMEVRKLLYSYQALYLYWETEPKSFFWLSRQALISVSILISTTIFIKITLKSIPVQHCCESGMFIRDPDSELFPPRSRIRNNELTKHFSIFKPKLFTKLSDIWSKMCIPESHWHWSTPFCC